MPYAKILTTVDIGRRALPLARLRLKRQCKGERRRRAGHYKQEWTIIKPQGSRAVASEVSLILKTQFVSFLLTTYRYVPR